MRYLALLTFACLITFSCKSDKKDTGIDLMKYGMPIKIDAPVDSEVVSTDYGFARDITVKSGAAYDIQIVSSTALTYDVKSILAEKKKEVEESLFFSKVIFEDESGFIYEKKISEDKLKYDFRLVRIQGDMEFVFQSGLTGSYNQEQIEHMYVSVK